MHFHRPLRRIHSKFRRPVFRQVCHQPEQLIPLRIWRLLHPNLIQQPHRLPRPFKFRLQSLHSLFNFPPQQHTPHTPFSQRPSPRSAHLSSYPPPATTSPTYYMSKSSRPPPPALLPPSRATFTPAARRSLPPRIPVSPVPPCPPESSCRKSCPKNRCRKSSLP